MTVKESQKIFFCKAFINRYLSRKENPGGARKIEKMGSRIIRDTGSPSEEGDVLNLD